MNAGFVIRTLREPEPAVPGARPPQHAKPPLDLIMEHHLERMTEGLQLDEAQRTAIRRAHDALFPAIRDAFENVEALRIEAARAFAEDVGTPDVFRARVLEIQQSRA
ncbi:hypothetical protein K8I85_10555, partial [bacterium]|nr:hypothetical protein [bacterium]